MSALSIGELQTIFNLIIDKLNVDKVHAISFDIHQYWIILSDEWPVTNNPPIPAVGSLDEDIEYLKEAIKEGELFSYSNFDRIATVLRAISEMQAPSK